MHPLAIHRSGGANGISHGDRVRHDVDGLTGVLDEALHDGDAFVTWDDGAFGTVKWSHLTRLPL